MKNDYIVRAKKFLDVFSKYLPDKPYIGSYDVKMAIDIFTQDFPSRQIYTECGSSRVVFFTSDYAVKIDTSSENYWGTCDDEMKVYEFAREHGYSHLFIPVTQYKINHQIFYIYPRIKSTIYDRGTYKGDADDDDAYLEYFHDGNDRWFLDKYIGDLHLGNISTFHGKPIVIDYACHSPLKWQGLLILL